MISITSEEYHCLRNDYAGLCLSCSEVVESGVEPDAEGYECEACGSNSVCGIEQALLLGELDITSDEE
jgi:hypothetical protein